MLEFFENIVCYLLEISIFYVLVSTLLNFSIVRNAGRIFAIPLFALSASYMEQVFSFHKSFLFVNIILELLCLYFLIRCPFLDTVILFFFSYLLTVGVQIIIMPFLTSQNTQPDSMVVSITGNSIILLSSVLAYLFLSQYHIYGFIQKNLTFKLILGNFFIIFFGIVCYSKWNPDGFYSFFFLLFICILFIFMLNWDVLQNQKKLLDKEKELEIYQAYIPVISELIDQVRIRQHQFDNHLQAVKMLPATHKDYDSLADALTNYSEHIAMGFKYLSPLQNLTFFRRI